MPVKLRDYQMEAVEEMHNGCILCGDVGSGKSITSLAYYYIQEGGKLDDLPYRPSIKMRDLYIITTAKKRDSGEWESELLNFGLYPGNSWQQNEVVVDSWNNIKKYQNIYGAFFIFDEQRVTGKGAWVKAFLKIANKNKWILLSATPGDKWEDYYPVFRANGFYRTKWEFESEHLVYSPYVKFKKVMRYINQGKLIKQRNDLLVMMEYRGVAEHYDHYIPVEYDVAKYKLVALTRQNPETGEPFQNASAYTAYLRAVTNDDDSRDLAVLEIKENYDRVIIFYNFNRELERLKKLDWGDDVEVAEWNGHQHKEIPKTKKWVYLVQYNSGSEGWNCIETNCIIFYSQTWSYRMLKQAKGRVDRMNTPYTELHYYHLVSKSPIDMLISKALKGKKDFNAHAFAVKMGFVIVVHKIYFLQKYIFFLRKRCCIDNFSYLCMFKKRINYIKL